MGHCIGPYNMDHGIGPDYGRYSMVDFSNQYQVQVQVPEVKHPSNCTRLQ